MFRKYISYALYLPTLVLVLSLPMISTNAVAAGAEEAKQFVDEIGKKVIGVIDGSGSSSEKQSKLQSIFTENVDLDWMAQFVLGRAWQSATPEQQQSYKTYYKDYVLARYTSRFQDYTGAKYTITDAKSKEAGQFTVNMQIKAPEQSQKTLAGYRLREDSGQFKIIDIIIEGVSMITTQRSEFGAVLEQKGMDGLIEELKGKASAEKTE